MGEQRVDGLDLLVKRYEWLRERIEVELEVEWESSIKGIFILVGVAFLIVVGIRIYLGSAFNVNFEYLALLVFFIYLTNKDTKEGEEFRKRKKTKIKGYEKEMGEIEDTIRKYISELPAVNYPVLSIEPSGVGGYTERYRMDGAEGGWYRVKVINARGEEEYVDGYFPVNQDENVKEFRAVYLEKDIIKGHFSKGYYNGTIHIPA